MGGGPEASGERRAGQLSDGGTPVSDYVDVLIVGAGLWGIGAAHHLQAAFPDKTYTILEARDVIGGTWDLFRYPGVRSDSDTYTLGYRFRPWTEAEGDRGRPGDPRLRRATAAETGHRAARSASSTG